MKSTLLLLILFFLFGCKESKSLQDNTPKKKQNRQMDERCKKGEQEAKNDLENNDWGLYFYGRTGPRYNTWLRLIRKEYQLKVKGGGDISSKEGDCYNRIMIKKIKEKYGADAFEKITTKVDSLYAIDLGDRTAKYKGGEKALLKYIYCNIPDDVLVENNEAIPRIIFQVSIDKDGHVINKGIIRKNKFAETNERYTKVAIEIINKMPKWIPAIENEKNIAVHSYYIPFKFEKKLKDKNCR